VEQRGGVLKHPEALFELAASRNIGFLLPALVFKAIRYRCQLIVIKLNTLHRAAN
jgi:hypothetical protein